MIISKFFKPVNNAVNSLLVKVDNKKIVTDNLSENDIKKRKNIQQIPNKSLTAPFDEEDFNVLKLFYGNVDIKMEEKNSKGSEGKFYVLNIYRKNESNKLCSLSIKNDVGKRLMRLYNIDLNKTIKSVFIAFATQLIEKQKGNQKYKNGFIKHSDFCFITVE